MSRRKEMLPPGHIMPEMPEAQPPTEAKQIYHDMFAAIQKWGGSEYADSLKRRADEEHDRILPPGGLDFERADMAAMEQATHRRIIELIRAEVATHESLARTLIIQEPTLFSELRQ